MTDFLLLDDSPKLDQYFTPTWAAELLVQRHFPDLTDNDVVADPSCGDGRFLLALPSHVQGFGVELDAATAATARTNSGRHVIVGDFRVIDLPQRPTVIVGNPPFQTDLINGFLERCYQELEYGGRVGFILPVYYFQTAGPVMRLGRRWSIAQELIPRNLFDGLRRPILFATFTKAKCAVLSGFCLYAETAAMEGLRKEFREMFVGNGSRASVWRETLFAALKICGGEADLEEIYQCIERCRPTGNPFWRERLRNVASKHAVRVRLGRYALPEAA